MPDIVATADVLRQHIETNLVGNGLPLVWENVLFDPSSAHARDGFIETTIRRHKGEQLTIGSPGANIHRDIGEVEMLVHVPFGSLPGAAEAKAETVRSIWQSGAQFPGLDITSRSVESGYRSGPQSRWWCVPVIVTFTSDYLD